MFTVDVDNVSKRFRRQTVQPATSLKTTVMDFILQRRRPKEDATFQALKDITFAVEHGQTLGIIGRNGSGKSTLLKLLAGIYRPDCGKITVQGKAGALLELGAGFHPEFSGRENILINGIVLGLSKREVRQRFDEIVRFAELEGFIDEPVKTYSSGMYMRLGFSVAVHADPDILLIDEILAVGDAAFNHKCAEKIAEFRERGKTIIMVSHDLVAVEAWSDEVLWLEKGMIRERGKPQAVIELYQQGLPVHEGNTVTVEHPGAEQEGREGVRAGMPKRWGGGEVEIASVQMVDDAARPRSVYHSGEQVRVLLRYKVHRSASDVVFGIGIRRADDLWCYGSNTDIEGVPVPFLGHEGAVEVLLTRLDLLAGTYYLEVAVQARDGYVYDYHHRLHRFTVNSERQDIGVFRIPHSWTITPLPSDPPPQMMSAQAVEPVDDSLANTLQPINETGQRE